MDVQPARDHLEDTGLVVDVLYTSLQVEQQGENPPELETAVNISLDTPWKSHSEVRVNVIQALIHRLRSQTIESS